MSFRSLSFGLNYWSYITSLAIGSVVGFIGGPVIALIWWAFFGLLIGWLGSRRKASLFNGALYGFAISYVFMVASYSGHESLTTKLIPFIVFGLFGSLCGACLGLLGNLIPRKA